MVFRSVIAAYFHNAVGGYHIIKLNTTLPDVIDAFGAPILHESLNVSDLDECVWSPSITNDRQYNRYILIQCRTVAAVAAILVLNS
ncbi:unnamed protein product [Angiostrongylus costaricensis]|uniref:Uncharacterized protein n=1 Tax=Angiostrongylus costaricensis TaxID=334426 RepID=A0A0R3PQH9_ANGCS|nr:unnamed protein product [Angiostrongylus costaricensis]